MDYFSAYRIPDINDRGYEDSSNYITVNSAGYYRFDNKHQIRHREKGRNDYLLVYIHSGQAVIKIDSVVHHLEKGHLFLFHPGEEQYYGQLQQCHIENHWLHFTGYGIAEVLKSLDLYDKRIYACGVHHEIMGIIKQIMNETHKKRAGYETACASLLLELLVYISRTITAPKDHQSPLHNSLSYIHNHYNQQSLTTGDLAQRCGFSVNHYINLFQRLTGLTPKQYLIQIRLEKAQELLLRTDMNIRQVSRFIGFADPLYFSRLFKTHYGLSPKLWQKKNLLL